MIIFDVYQLICDAIVIGIILLFLILQRIGERKDRKNNKLHFKGVECMEDVENVIKKLSDVSAMLFQMYKDETDKENISIRYDQFLAVDNSIELLKAKQGEHKRLVSWLSKFCRHIDNGDKWLTDEENLEFFREKMKQQFGWDDI